MRTTTREHYVYMYQLPQSRLDNICNRIEHFMLKVGYQNPDIIEYLQFISDSKISDVYNKGVVDISDLIGKDRNGYYIDITIDNNDDEFYVYSI